ncbi:hypothetical protein GMST_13700 [Geomonas silvestris]|uniref:6-hydroxymethylpterin diphosphokinase MptE-like domain-containing protein n=1 Tax=Geomonas silvestris TaxID=2740184 RepID=A0A6V8MGE6_9BACT|nr:6-hydroxymethylpterin diphosphokinase MptE-like protein [Geomonas silvestris]GFO59045.1 hypothetical protein GMST_13700 [Geomonas silvestris]
MRDIENNLGHFVTNAFGDRYLYSINRNAFSRIGSDALYSSLYGEKLFQEFQLNVIIGTDSGLLPQYIAKCGVPSGSRYVFVELPSILEVLGQLPGWEELPSEISVLSLDDFMGHTEAHQLTSYAFLDAVKVHESVGSRDANLIEYRELSWDLNLALKNLLQKIVLSANNFPFISRQWENLTENQVPFSQVLPNAFAGRTAIVLAGGPSLTEVLPWVKQNRDRILIIAVSRICRTLREAGIVPHIVASVDPTILSFEISREMLLFADLPEPPLFVGSYHVVPQLVGQWRGDYLYSGPLFPWHTPLNSDTLLYHGPTVSNFSISLCMHMGCTTIVLAGVDNCFSSAGQTHAAGSNESKVGPDLGQTSSRIETYGGWQAETNYSFSASIGILTLQAQELEKRGIGVYNCSRNAAVVPFIGYKPLDELDLADGAAPPSSVIRSRMPESTAATRLVHYRRIKKEIQRARSKFQGILTLSREALRCTDGLFGRNGRKRDFRHKIRMDKIEKRLDQNFDEFSILVKQCGIKRFLLSLKTTMAEEMTDEQVEVATREYYEAYEEGALFLINRMDDLVQRIDARIEEDGKKPDFDLLAAQWEIDLQCGRVQLWRQRNPDKVPLLTETQRGVLDRLEQEFTRVMTEERTTHIMLLERAHDLAHARSKVLLLFKRQKVSELESMATGLAGHPDPDKALPYLHFVQGLLAELKGETAEAIGHYQQLFTDPPHQLTEDALLQVVHLSLAENDPDNALMALECLVGFSPIYLTVYAELLKAVGRFEDAFNALRHYISLVPDDAGALISLGLMCREAGIVEAAAELFQRVLEKDPLNGAAQKLLAELEPSAGAVACQG